jgi:hypothetical protein
MGIALLSIADFLTPLQSLADRWIPRRRSGRGMSSGLRYVGIRPNCALRHGAGGGAAAASTAPALPLRVVRMVDSQHPGRAAGRMVISGRMADVCAELDRLVALEAATALPRAQLH